MFGQFGRAFGLLVSDQGAEGDRVPFRRGVDGDVSEATDAADVDDVAGAAHAQCHQRNQALAAREDLGLVAMLGEIRAEAEPAPR